MLKATEYQDLIDFVSVNNLENKNEIIKRIKSKIHDQKIEKEDSIYNEKIKQIKELTGLEVDYKNRLYINAECVDCGSNHIMNWAEINEFVFNISGENKRYRCMFCDCKQVKIDYEK